MSSVRRGTWQAQGFIRRWWSRSVRGGVRKRRVEETLSVRQPDDPCPTVDLRAPVSSPPSLPPDWLLSLESRSATSKPWPACHPCNTHLARFQASEPCLVTPTLAVNIPTLAVNINKQYSFHLSFACVLAGRLLPALIYCHHIFLATNCMDSPGDNCYQKCHLQRIHNVCRLPSQHTISNVQMLGSIMATKWLSTGPMLETHWILQWQNVRQMLARTVGQPWIGLHFPRTPRMDQRTDFLWALGYVWPNAIVLPG